MVQIVNIRTPSNLDELRSFSGGRGFSKTFIYDFVEKSF